MLYERWRQIAATHSHETALIDAGRGERLTFGELAARAETGGSAGHMAFPQGRDFILALLQAWRLGQIVCPLEAGQAQPDFQHLPPGCVHFKTTSATLGTARTIAFRAEQLIADADNIVATMGLRPDWPNLGAISLAHSYGFSNLALPLLLHGIPLILADSPLPESIRMAAGQAARVTIAAVPALWRAWHEAGAIPENTRLAISASAPLSLMLERSVHERLGLKLHNFYGSSECGGIAYDASNGPRSDSDWVGAPMKNVELSVAANGCLMVRGGAVAQTYWPTPEANLADGCFQTSDLAEIVDGGVCVRGRAADQINIAGRKLCPESIEKVLLTHPDVKDCLVFGAPSADTERGEAIVACVCGGRPLATESLRQFLLDRLPAWQIPREWLFVKSLNANNRGKLSRADWRRKFLAEGRRMTEF